MSFFCNLKCFFINRQITPPQSLMQIFEDPLTVQVSRKESKREVRRLPSAPIPNPFRTANRYGGDIVASETGQSHCRYCSFRRRLVRG